VYYVLRSYAAKQEATKHFNVFCTTVLRHKTRRTTNTLSTFDNRRLFLHGRCDTVHRNAPSQSTQAVLIPSAGPSNKQSKEQVVANNQNSRVAVWPARHGPPSQSGCKPPQTSAGPSNKQSEQSEFLLDTVAPFEQKQSSNPVPFEQTIKGAE
jgi:hypothetical protein